MRPIIALIDPDIADYADILPNLLPVDNCELRTFYSLNEAMPFLRSPDACRIKVLILEIGIAYGPTSANQPACDTFTALETNNGNYTGLRLLEAVRKSEREFLVPHDVPAIFFTLLRDYPIAEMRIKELGAEYIFKMPVTNTSGGFSNLANSIKAIFQTSAVL